MEVGIHSEKKYDSELRVLVWKFVDTRNAKIDKDVQCAATNLNFIEGS